MEPMFDIIADLTGSEFLCKAMNPLCPATDLPATHDTNAPRRLLFFLATAIKNSSLPCAFCDLLPLESSGQKKPQLAELRQTGTRLCDGTSAELTGRQECNTQVHLLSAVLEELDWRTAWRRVHASTCRTKLHCWEMSSMPNQCYNSALGEWKM